MTVDIRTFLILSERRHTPPAAYPLIPLQPRAAASAPPGSSFPGLFGCLFLSLCGFLQPRFVCFQYFPVSFAKRGGGSIVANGETALCQKDIPCMELSLQKIPESTRVPLCSMASRFDFRPQPSLVQHFPHSFVTLVPPRSLFSTLSALFWQKHRGYLPSACNGILLI